VTISPFLADSEKRRANKISRPDYKRLNNSRQRPFVHVYGTLDAGWPEQSRTWKGLSEEAADNEAHARSMPRLGSTKLSRGQPRFTSDDDHVA
jgi:hypothetical protein